MYLEHVLVIVVDIRKLICFFSSKNIRCHPCSVSRTEKTVAAEIRLWRVYVCTTSMVLLNMKCHFYFVSPPPDLGTRSMLQPPPPPPCALSRTRPMQSVFDILSLTLVTGRRKSEGGVRIFSGTFVRARIFLNLALSMPHLHTVRNNTIMSVHGCDPFTT